MSGAARTASRGGRRFGKGRRLLKGVQFERVFAQAMRSRDSHFTVLARPNGLPHPRLGVAVGRRHLRRAVARNRVKRIVRESFRHHADELSGMDLVVVNRGNGMASNEQLYHSLARHWRSLAGRLRSPGVAQSPSH